MILLLREMRLHNTKILLHFDFKLIVSRTSTLINGFQSYRCLDVSLHYISTPSFSLCHVIEYTISKR